MADGSVKIDIEADGSKAEKELEGVEAAARDAGEGAEKAGDGARKAGEGFEAAAVAAGTFVADGLKAIISGAVDTVRALLELSESTREYREDMARLETAFTTQGISAEAAKGVYEDFYAILGESDRSVEAANHLAELTSNEQELAQWGTIAAGVSAKFGDSLPIEGLTEAANETAKTGQVTGVLADALSWATKEGETFGVTLKEQIPFTEKTEKELKYLTEAQREEYEATKAQHDEIAAWNEAVTEAASAEDYFNLALSQCTTEQERAKLITDTLNGTYSEAAAEFLKATKSTREAREATMRMEDAQAELGAAIEPVTTAWTNLKAKGLEAIKPAIEFVANKIQELTDWMKEHETAATIIKGVIIGLAAAFAVFAVALGIAGLIQIVTVAMASLGGVIAFVTSPITLIIAAIAGLVAAFIYLWNNCDAFRAFWFVLWEQIKVIAAQVWAAIVQVFQAAWTGIQAIWDYVSPYFMAVWETIKGVFAVVKSVLSGNFSDAWIAIKGIASVWASFFAGVWSNIRAVFAVVGEWFRGIFKGAYDAITNIWDSISGYFSDLYADITGAFSGVLSDFAGVGSDIITGIWNGINAGWDWLTGKVKSLAESLLKAAKDALGIKSPSREFAYIGKMSAEGVSVGFEDNMPDAINTVQSELDALTARVYAAVGAESARAGRSMGRPESGFTDLARAVGLQTAGITSLSSEYRRGAGNMRPVILELNGRELGRAVVNVGAAENSRVGAKLALGGAL